MGPLRPYKSRALGYSLVSLVLNPAMTSPTIVLSND